MCNCFRTAIKASPRGRCDRVIGPPRIPGENPGSDWSAELESLINHKVRDLRNTLTASTFPPFNAARCGRFPLLVWCLRS